MSVKSKLRLCVCFGFALLLPMLASKIRATFSTNEKQNRDQSGLARAHFPVLCTLIRILIGSLDGLHLL